MLFRLTLWIISLRISWLIRHNKIFKYAVREKSVILQFMISGNKAVRFFEFNQGVFVSRAGGHAKQVLARSKGIRGERIAVFIFQSPGDAMALLKEGVKDETAMLSAVREKRLTVEGDFTLFTWFGWLADQLK